jgi:hypothetical protein
MPEGHTYTFNSRATDHSTAFLIQGDKVGFLAEAIFPPAGTLVSLVDGTTAVVKSSRLDISNDSGYAMVYVDMEPSKEHVKVPPVRIR